ncbi:hypothetical protein [Candidatus Odyssella acanthamoebae]|uniref:Uncharacterized protein n=1 Tax=Candidatus Odyssella acanthamoebae TaxID=91604 RepID=A0A077AYB3_9PROT|nr:hypothetical protein [Candidatus Paracaedibacter acanthamoebae]AIK96974.1 hypothetical protein ID47_09900 [Candidatus Paracaedibacter acanthamoebae]
MSTITREKISFFGKNVGLLAIGVMGNMVVAAAVDHKSLIDNYTIQPSDSLIELFQHLTENFDDSHYQATFNLSKTENRPLTEILDLSSQDAWNSVVHYLAKSDFILSATYSYRNLSNIDFLKRLNMQKDRWNTHVLGIGGQLEGFGKVLVSDKRFGLQLHNLITSRFQLTTFMHLKYLAQAVSEAKTSDSTINNAWSGAKQVIENYLENHNLLSSPT